MFYNTILTISILVVILGGTLIFTIFLLKWLKKESKGWNPELAEEIARLIKDSDDAAQKILSGFPTASTDVPAQIEKLDVLRKSGAITESEFQHMKSELIKKI